LYDETTATAATDSRAGLTRRRLLAAAEAEFGTRGFHHTQVADVTERAGLGIGTFYRYFADKESALQAVLDDFFTKIRRDLVALRAGIETRPPAEQIDMIRQTFRVMFTELSGRPLVAMIMFRGGYGVSPTINDLIWGFVRGMTDDVASDIERAVAARLLEAPRPDILADCIAGVVMQVGHRMLVDGDHDTDAAVEMCTRFTLGGLAGFATDDYFEAMAPAYRTMLRWPSEPFDRSDGGTDE
jgi:AcrR family transcriptional regulator